jgi:hypothetical protein
LAGEVGTVVDTSDGRIVLEFKHGERVAFGKMSSKFLKTYNPTGQRKSTWSKVEELTGWKPDTTD